MEQVAPWRDPVQPADHARHLIQAMPMLVVGLVAAAWIVVQRVRLRRTGGDQGRGARCDFAVSAALAASWLSVWGLCAAYAWTAHPGLTTLQTVRSYVPALGAIALLGAGLLVRGRRTNGAANRLQLTATASAAVIVAVAGPGLWSFHDMVAAQHSSPPPPPRCNIGEPPCPAKPPATENHMTRTEGSARPAVMPRDRRRPRTRRPRGILLTGLAGRSRARSCGARPPVRSSAA